jgi:hypothetical protein
MSATIRLEQEGQFVDWTTRDLAEHAVELLREGDVILGDGDLDYAAADMLEILITLHDEGSDDQPHLDLELLPQVRAFAIVLLDGAGWSE